MLAMTGNLQADTAPFIDWVSDSSSLFNVTLTGTGAGWSGTITSPSGLWQLNTGNIVGYDGANEASRQVFVENVGNATFEGQLPSQFPAPNPAAVVPFNAATIGTYGGYMDYFSPQAPINDKSSLVYGYLNELSDYGPYADWSGICTFCITSMMNPNDPSTWTWTAEYTACGQNLATPEPKTISICALAGLFCATWMFCKRYKFTLKLIPSRIPKCPIANAPMGSLDGAPRLSPAPPIVRAEINETTNGDWGSPWKGRK
jgi:hypothetical protein